MSTLRLTEPSPRKACKDGFVENAETEGERGLMNGESSFAAVTTGDVGREEGLRDPSGACAVELSSGVSTGISSRQNPAKAITDCPRKPLSRIVLLLCPSGLS
jgi:hypothetical protein